MVEHQILAAEGVQRQQRVLGGRQQHRCGVRRHVGDLRAVGRGQAEEGDQEGNGQDQVGVAREAKQGEDAAPVSGKWLLTFMVSIHWCGLGGSQDLRRWCVAAAIRRDELD
ncbi:hypothetical protein ACFFU8_05585 [Chromobacterium piscinae]|uniref:hypothetical protein n=1 Tax=Chromobacterium piscinae TaxID=686831 RepID=UPI001E5B23B4|nr:hypothetical protein [Chromobacterium piscinae]MCD5328137.1 hypothetical protein [Chromobacterium piscinae]